MRWLTSLLRRFAKWQFKRRGLSSITGIPTEQFNRLIAALRAEGWKKTSEYSGFDAWIDYGYICLKKDGVKLKFEWDNWDEGSVEGPAAAIQGLGNRFGYPTISEWRGSSRDQFIQSEPASQAGLIRTSGIMRIPFTAPNFAELAALPADRRAEVMSLYATSRSAKHLVRLLQAALAMAGIFLISAINSDGLPRVAFCFAAFAAIIFGIVSYRIGATRSLRNIINGSASGV
jgi:hypothetical protein